MSFQSPSSQVFLFLGTFCSLWCVEYFFQESSKKNKIHHAGPNLLFIFTALPVQLCVSVGVVFVSYWCTRHNWGFLNFISHSEKPWVKYVVGFLFLDLMDYLYHVLMHKIKVFWRFHKVHHTDDLVDVSTTLREHPGETFVRVSFLCLFVFLSGASIPLLILRQSIQTISNLIAHTQLRLPVKIEKTLGILLVTPHIHSIHHHDVLPYTDSNYGDVLSIWDRMFGTYRDLDRSEICHGLDIIRPEQASGFKNLIKIPFLAITRR
ncbi:MAG: sterol desaturase family protein [Pedobacter sp.]|nr:sterol desaturase family protein [Pedobacter sp.]